LIALEEKNDYLLKELDFMNRGYQKERAEI
jgi:hypothetical protein